MSTRDEVQPVTDPYQFAAPYAWMLVKDGKPQGIPIAHRPSDWLEIERVWGATFTPLYPLNTMASDLLEAQWKEACALAQDYCQRRGIKEYGRSVFALLVEDADRMAERIAQQEARIRELEGQLSALVAREAQRESGKNFLRGVAAPEVYRG